MKLHEEAAELIVQNERAKARDVISRLQMRVDEQDKQIEELKVTVMRLSKTLATLVRKLGP